jgi:dienelactone hydrolase
MRQESVTYRSDGKTMQSILCLPDREGRVPGVLVFPEAFGLGEHAIERAKRLAELGYAALACDLHGDGKLIGDMETLMAVFRPLAADRPRVRALARDAFDVIAARAEVKPAAIAAIGFCFGGTLALELARDGVSIAGAAGFHSGLATSGPVEEKTISAPVVVYIGADDPSIDQAQRAAFETEMQLRHADWRMVLYGGVVHSFTNPDADTRNMPDFARYSPEADSHSWNDALAFFHKVFA